MLSIWRACLSRSALNRAKAVESIWYTIVRYGTIWYGMVWYGMVWYGMVWYGTIPVDLTR